MITSPCNERTMHDHLARIHTALESLDRLNLPLSSQQTIQIIAVRRLAREIETSNPRHFGHGERTAVYAMALGQLAGFGQASLHDLHLAALLHDVGLLTLPTRLLSVQGPFDGHVYALVQSHPRVGAELLRPFHFLHSAATLIAHHHERWDGSGYPYGLKGPFIPQGSRILAIADAFDAIQTHRNPDTPLSLSIALRILRVSTGSQFDPELVELFGQLMQNADDSLYPFSHARSITPSIFGLDEATP